MALVVASCSGTPAGGIDGAPLNDAGLGDSRAADVSQADIAIDVPMDAGSCANPDQDGDGVRSVACGGTDCDDNDPNRFPGNPEVCRVVSVGGADGGVQLTRTDLAHGIDPTHDEDCDPTTFANAMPPHDGDHDGDGDVDVACSNTDRSGMTYHGTDCQDLSPVAAVPASLRTTVPAGDIHPMQPELCNGVDDNCDGQIDEGNPGGGGSCANPFHNVCATALNQCVMGSITCVASTTLPLTCCSGTADCDSSVANGCEISTQGDVHNCGACGHVCPPPTGGTAGCASGTCSGSCPSGQTDCGGACSDLTVPCNNGLPGYCAQTGTYSCASGGASGRVCNLGAPMLWPGDQVYRFNDSRLSHGTVYDGSSCGFDSGVSWALNDFNPGYAPCDLQLGPFVALPSGSYNVAFAMSWGTGYSGSDTLHSTLEVTMDSGATVLGSTVLNPLRSAPTGSGIFNVPFTITGTCATNVEFRVHVNDINNGDIAISSTTLHKM